MPVREGGCMDGRLRNMTAVYLLRGSRVLLLYRQGGRVVNDVWTGSAGGHFERDELNDARACVLREQNEELGLRPEDIEGLALRYIALSGRKGEIRQNYYFFAELGRDVDENLSSSEGTCRWFELDEIHSLAMPYSAKHVMEHYCAEGRRTDALYVAVSGPEGVRFCALKEF